MLCDDAQCDDCGWRGCDCTCPREKGPSWSPERRRYDYNKMQWWNKLELFDPIALSIWQSQGQYRLVPSYEQSLTIRKKENPCFVD